jgi:hypothetical protein
MVLVESFRSIKIKVNANDHNPPHCHIDGNGGIARYNLLKHEWMTSDGFTRKDLEEIKEVIERRYDEIMNTWKELHDA